MSGVLAILATGTSPTVPVLIGTRAGNAGSTAQGPAGAQAGDLGTFVTFDLNGSPEEHRPPGDGWVSRAAGPLGNELYLYWKFLTPADLTATRSGLTSPWCYAVYRNPVAVGFRSADGFAKSTNHLGLLVATRASAVPTGATYTLRQTGGSQYRLYDNYPPLASYTDGAAIGSSTTVIPLEMMSA